MAKSSNRSWVIYDPITLCGVVRHVQRWRQAETYTGSHNGSCGFNGATHGDNVGSRELKRYRLTCGSDAKNALVKMIAELGNRIDRVDCFKSWLTMADSAVVTQ